MLLRALLLVSSVVLACAGLPRGVPPSRSAFYARAKEFQCLDGSARIPYEQVNDDYCDCTDGSDEPGTSACSNGLFYCANKLHTAEMVFSSRVNDGICDCCDGSDEYDSQVTCPNTCEELGRSARLDRERKSAMHKAGWEKRKELVAEGLRIKEEKEAGVVSLRAEKDALEPEKAALEAAHKVAQDLDKATRDEHNTLFEAARNHKKAEVAGLLFGTIDANKDGKLTLDELKATKYLDSNRDGAVDDVEAKLFLGENDEADLAHFTDKSFHTVRQMRRDAVAAEKRAADDAAHLEGGEEVADIDKHADDDDNDDVVEEHHPLPVADEAPVDEFDDDVPFPAYTDEQNKIFEASTDARHKVDEHKRKMDEIEDKIKDAESFSSLDFGTDLAWAPLKGKCIEYEEGQYVYKICPFDKCTQKDKGGYGETNLGNWKEWTLPYSEMSYTGGQGCWNGPERSTKVSIQCGDDDVLVSAEEPGRCEYHFMFRTPAACEDPATMQQAHQEL